jgi:hypothetical protein
VRQYGFESIVAAQTGATFDLRHEVFNPEGFGVFHNQAQWYHGGISSDPLCEMSGGLA